MNPIVFWALLLVFFLVLEAATYGLTAIWFALGAVGALISAAVAPTWDLWWLQVLIFLAISGVTLYFTRPLAKKLAMAKETATNANRVLDMIGTVRETVDNIQSRGTVHVNGKLWSARAESMATIPEGTLVDILRIEGVKLIVRPHVSAPADATSQTPGA